MVKAGFSKIADEISSVHDWLFYFYDYNQRLLNFLKDQDSKLKEQEDQIYELKLTIESMPKTREEFKQLVDSYYSLNGIIDRLKAIEQRLDHVEVKASLQRVSQPSQPASNIRERVLKKIARSSKDYIKNLVLSLVSKYGKVSALQLREIIVEEQGLCSKSSFYRILEELEREDQLNIISRGKIKVYLATQKSGFVEQ